MDDSKDIRIDFEYIDRIKNKHRKAILLALYKSPQHYKELVSLTNLKPGSIYHHLGVLEPLARKTDHGLYEITSMGTDLLEALNLVEKQKPKVSEQKDPIEISSDSQDNLLVNVWLGKVNYILIIFTLSITFGLTYFGVALAGSALYPIGDWRVILIFDALAFLLGWSAYYFSEILTLKNRIYNIFKFTIAIRVLSMLPGAIVGLSLFILFIFGITPSDSFYPWLMGITTILGYVLAASGLYYLRGRDRALSLLISGIAGSIDVLFGLIVFFSF